MEDGRIVSLFFERNEDALVACEGTYGKYLRKVLFGILRNDEDCEECMNDILMAAWNAIPPTRPLSLKTYLASLARNIGIDRYKRSNRQKRKGETEELLEEITSLSSDDSPEDSLMAKTVMNDVNDFLATLDTETRVCFILRYYYAATNEEIAEKTGKNTHAVVSLLSKTRMKLKQYLSEHGTPV